MHQELSDEILFKIFHFCTSRDLLKLRKVSKQLARISEDRKLWQAEVLYEYHRARVHPQVFGNLNDLTLHQLERLAFLSKSFTLDEAQLSSPSAIRMVEKSLPRLTFTLSPQPLNQVHLIRGGRFLATVRNVNSDLGDIPGSAVDLWELPFPGLQHVTEGIHLLTSLSLPKNSGDILQLDSFAVRNEASVQMNVLSHSDEESTRYTLTTVRLSLETLEMKIHYAKTFSNIQDYSTRFFDRWMLSVQETDGYSTGEYEREKRETFLLLDTESGCGIWFNLPDERIRQIPYLCGNYIVAAYAMDKGRGNIGLANFLIPNINSFKTTALEIHSLHPLSVLPIPELSLIYPEDIENWLDAVQVQIPNDIQPSSGNSFAVLPGVTMDTDPSVADRILLCKIQDNHTMTLVGSLEIPGIVTTSFSHVKVHLHNSFDNEVRLDWASKEDCFNTAKVTFKDSISISSQILNPRFNGTDEVWPNMIYPDFDCVQCQFSGRRVLLSSHAVLGWDVLTINVFD